MNLEDSELESYKKFCQKRELRAVHGRHHRSDPDKCKRRSPKFRPDWMNKCIEQHSVKHRDKPQKTITFGLLFQIK